MEIAMRLLLAVVTLAIAQPTLAGEDATIHAGGSTLIAPLMRKWASEYRKLSGVSIDYSSTGSGMGITGMTDKSLDFGCTDAPMNDAELEAANQKGGAVAHIPLAMGSVAPVYNLPDAKERLRFTGPLLADIFMGRVHRWNDPAIASLNPNVPLPDREITTVHRLDSSGTTYVWADYLAKVSPEWRKALGVAKSINWPTGITAQGNERVAGQVKQIPNSIGYAQLTYGISEVLSVGAVKNADGEFIDPRPAAVTAAAENSVAVIPDDLRFSIVDSHGKDSYPISTVTWAIVYVSQPSDRDKLVNDFLRWAIHDGQQYAEPLSYAPLPRPLVARAESQIVRATAAR
jgi:phosphate ABC transporter phosphate-binding protein